jgi:hypothetical protein
LYFPSFSYPARPLASISRVDNARDPRNRSSRHGCTFKGISDHPGRGPNTITPLHLDKSVSCRRGFDGLRGRALMWARKLSIFDPRNSNAGPRRLCRRRCLPCFGFSLWGITDTRRKQTSGAGDRWPYRYQRNRLSSTEDLFGIPESTRGRYPVRAPHRIHE